MPYTLPAWQDAPSTATPISSANLTQANTAINSIDSRLTTVETGKVSSGLVNAQGNLISANGVGTATALLVGGNGQVLTADSSAPVGLKWATPTSGAAITTQDEGTTLTANTTAYNFTGAGVTATNSGGNVTVAVPGGSGGGAGIDTVDTPQNLGVPTPGVGPSASPADHRHRMPDFTALGGVAVATATPGQALVYDGVNWRPYRPAWGTILTAGETTIPRGAAGSDFNAPVASTAHYTCFTALTAAVVATVSFQTGSAGATGITLSRVGIVTVDPATGAMTLAASAPNRSAGWTGAYANYSEILAATYPLIPGNTYAIVMVQVGTTPAKIMGAWVNNQNLALKPRLAAQLATQTDLPATATDAALTDHSAAFFYAMR